VAGGPLLPRLGIDFYRQAGLLDIADPTAIRQRSLDLIGAANAAGHLGIPARLPDPAGYVDPDPTWIQAGDRVLLTGSKVQVAIAAVPASVVAAPAAFASWAVGGTLTAEGIGFAFGGADALLDPNNGGALDVLDRAAGGAGFGGAGTVAYLALGRIPVVGSKAQTALAALFVGTGAVGTYDSFSGGNYAQGILRGTGTAFGASALGGQFNPRLWLGNWTLTVEGSLAGGSRAGGVLIPGLRYTGPPSTNTIASYGQLRAAGERDAHHIIQDAAARDIPGYSYTGAPAIQLTGPPTVPGTPHYIATQVQASAPGGLRTFAYERFVSYIALRRAGVPEAQARAAIEQYVDPYFNSLGVSPSTPMRPVGNRP
jgi:hypothetical protein